MRRAGRDRHRRRRHRTPRRRATRPRRRRRRRAVGGDGPTTGGGVGRFGVHGNLRSRAWHPRPDDQRSTARREGDVLTSLGNVRSRSGRTGQLGGNMSADTAVAPLTLDATAAPRRRITGWLVMVGVVIMLAGAAVRLRPGRHLRRAAGHPARLHGRHDAQTEIVTSWVTLGALVGALVAGILADRLGRTPDDPRRRRPVHGRRRRRGVRAGTGRPRGRPVRSSASASAWRRWPRRSTPRRWRPPTSAAASCRPTSSPSRSASSSPTSSTTC